MKYTEWSTWESRNVQACLPAQANTSAIVNEWYTICATAAHLAFFTKVTESFSKISVLALRCGQLKKQCCCQDNSELVCVSPAIDAKSLDWMRMIHLQKSPGCSIDVAVAPDQDSVESSVCMCVCVGVGE